MTLPASGAINTAQVLAELRTANPGRTYPLSLLDSDILVLIGKSGPPVNFPGDFYGKTTGAGTFFVSSIDGNAGASSLGSGGTVTCAPSVSASGGSGSYTYAWSFTSNPNSCTLGNAANAACSVSHSYAKQSDGAASAVLQCVVTEVGGTGQSVTKTSINAYLDWSAN